ICSAYVCVLVLRKEGNDHVLRGCKNSVAAENEREGRCPMTLASSRSHCFSASFPTVRTATRQDLARRRLSPRSSAPPLDTRCTLETRPHVLSRRPSDGIVRRRRLHPSRRETPTEAGPEAAKPLRCRLRRLSGLQRRTYSDEQISNSTFQILPSI